jgi:catechol 2,3-dioxygenase-like lactoylglutathione lyase family enzyme
MKWHGNLLYVRNLTESVMFYEGVLGLPVVARPAPHMAIISLGNGVLYLHEDPSDAPQWLKEALGSKTRGTGIICHLEVADVAAVAEKLVAAGAEISRGPVRAHGQLQLYVYDPSGYNLVFVELLTD